MTIYPLPSGELDDDTLEEQIKAIAQTLCNVHYLRMRMNNETYLFIEAYKIPMLPKRHHDLFSLWAKECLANYNELVNTGLACCNEYVWRFSDFEWEDRIKKDQEGNYLYEYSEIVGTNELKEHELQPVIKWAMNNVPDLPVITCVNFYDKRNGKKPLYGRRWFERVEQITPFPVVMPKKYFSGMFDYKDEEIKHDVIQSYRNYYRAKLKKLKNAPTWTGRQMPEWLEDL
jgi:uncharacterized protein involved in tolerance to divalent cations